LVERLSLVVLANLAWGAPSRFMNWPARSRPASCPASCALRRKIEPSNGVFAPIASYQPAGLP